MKQRGEEDKMIKAVIFDSDGVVVDTTQYDYDAWKKTLSEYGIDLSFPEYKVFLGMKGTEVVKKYLPHFSEDSALAIQNKKEDYLVSLVQRKGVQMIDGALDFIKKLKSKKIRIALATASPVKKLDAIMSALQIRNRFDAIVTADDVSKGKPNPEIFLKAAKKLGVSPRESIVIEDAPNGVEAAKSGGFTCVAITTTHQQKELRGADHIIDSFSDFKLEWLK